jgi:hypothetical protein
MSDPARTPLPCGHCGKPPVASVGSVNLCVDCWHKYQIAQTLNFRVHAIKMNYAMDEMDYLSGTPREGPRMQLPPCRMVLSS